MFKIGFINRLSSLFPALKNQLRVANLPYTSVQFVKKGIKAAALNSLLFSVLFFFVIKKGKLSFFLLVPACLVLFILSFQYSMLSLKARIKRREKDINKEVIFVGRYLLVKLYAGRPLLNALIETANSRGVAAKYIKEIVDDIDTGNTIEDALNHAMIYSPSDKLRKVLFHINNALKLGIDVTKPLESVLEEITREEELEIKKYGKKLNTLVVLYMVAAVIFPSLGVSLFIVISSIVNFQINLTVLLVVTFFIIVFQFIFIAMFKSIRPMVSL